MIGKIGPEGLDGSWGYITSQLTESPSSCPPARKSGSVREEFFRGWLPDLEMEHGAPYGMTEYLLRYSVWFDGVACIWRVRIDVFDADVTKTYPSPECREAFIWGWEATSASGVKLVKGGHVDVVCLGKLLEAIGVAAHSRWEVAA